jgi:hypothetical protein
MPAVAGVLVRYPVALAGGCWMECCGKSGDARGALRARADEPGGRSPRSDGEQKSEERPGLKHTGFASP